MPAVLRDLPHWIDLEPPMLSSNFLVLKLARFVSDFPLGLPLGKYRCILGQLLFLSWRNRWRRMLSRVSDGTGTALMALTLE